MVYQTAVLYQITDSQQLHIITSTITLIGCQGNPVGISNSSIIPDNRFTASTYYDSRYEPKLARLNGAKWMGTKTTSDPNDYLQIDLGEVFVICAVATQGAGTRNNMWTTEYKISTSMDSITWTDYPNNASAKVCVSWIIEN